MLKKLASLLLSLLLCLSLLPSQAGAMDASKDESPVQAGEMENLDSSEDAGTGDAPCHMTTPDYSDLGGGPGGFLPGDPSKAANGKKYGLYDPSNPFKP